MAPRPETYGGACLAFLAAAGASKVVGAVADAWTGPASDGDVRAVAGDTGALREDPEAQLFFLLFCALLAGAANATWANAARAEVRRVVDPPPPANVAATCSLLAALLLAPYALLLEGPEAAAWWHHLPQARRAPALKVLLLAAAASHLKRELAAHSLRALGPTAGALATAAANVAAALAIVALATTAPPIAA